MSSKLSPCSTSAEGDRSGALQKRLLQVRDFVGNIAWLKPDGSNFVSWLAEVEFTIKCLIRKPQVLSNPVPLDADEDRIVHDVLRCSVDPVHRAAIYRATDSKAAFRSLSALFQSKNRATQLLLWHQILAAHFDPLGSDRLPAHIAKMGALFDQLELAGFDFSRETVAGIFLQLSLPVQRGGPFEHLNRALDLGPAKDGPISFTDVVGSATDELANFMLSTLASSPPAAVPAPAVAPSAGQVQYKPESCLPVQHLTLALAHPAQPSPQPAALSPPWATVDPHRPSWPDLWQADGLSGKDKPTRVDPLPGYGLQPAGDIGLTLKTPPSAHDLSLQKSPAEDGDPSQHSKPPAQYPKSSTPPAKPPTQHTMPPTQHTEPLVQSTQPPAQSTKPLAQHPKPPAWVPKPPAIVESAPAGQQAVASPQSTLAQPTEASVVTLSAAPINADHQSARPVAINACDGRVCELTVEQKSRVPVAAQQPFNSSVKVDANHRIATNAGGSCDRAHAKAEPLNAPDLTQASSPQCPANADHRSADSVRTESWGSGQASQQTSPAQPFKVADAAQASSTPKVSAHDEPTAFVEGNSEGAASREPMGAQKTQAPVAAQPSSNDKAIAQHSLADSVGRLPSGSDCAGHQTLPAQHSIGITAAQALSTPVKVNADCKTADSVEKKSGGEHVHESTVAGQAKVLVATQPCSSNVKTDSEHKSADATGTSSRELDDTSARPVVVEQSPVPVAAQASSSKIGDEHLSADSVGASGSSTMANQSISPTVAQAFSSQTFKFHIGSLPECPVGTYRFFKPRGVRRLPARMSVVPRAK